MKLKRPLRGSEVGADVRMVQRALNKWASGATPIPVSGKFDQRTSDRLMAFQLEQHVRPASGWFGQRSLDELWPYFDAYGRWRYRRFQPPESKPALIEPVQGWGSLHKSLWEAYSEGRRRGFTDLGTFVNKPGDHGIGPPCFAFDLGHKTRFFFKGWDYIPARRLVNWYVANHVRLEIEYVILGRRIWSRRNGWQPYTRDSSHDFHIHVSGHGAHDV